MRLQLFAFLALATQNINGASLPESDNALSLRESADMLPRAVEVVSPDHSLERRKGGGGRGGGSSGGSSSSGGGRSSGSSYSGGSTRAGSGPSRSYGRGGYYGGGAAVPYQAGSRTPKGLVAGAIIAPVAILAIMPGIWLYSVYPYYYNNPYRFYNRSGNATNNNGQPTKRQNSQQGANETLPVICLCQEFSVCGCDENTDQSYLDSIIGDGSYAGLNKSLVTVSQVNNTKHLVLNGSLPNGTTAPGGVDDAASALAIGKSAGYWFAGLLVLYGIML